MQASPPPFRPPLPHNDTIDKASRLVGELYSDGIASLKPQRSENGKAMSAADNGAESFSGDTSTPSEEEDYDALKPDPATIVSGSSGGGMMSTASSSGLDLDGSTSGETSAADDSQFLDSADVPANGSPAHRPARRKSIQVTLEKTDKKGRYVLKANDPEIRELLRRSIEREAAALIPADPSAKTKKRFRDLVFTRQFTTFDRQNPLSAESPFHGFFTLFWLVCAALLLRVAAQNWRTYGTVFGGNELMHLMFDRDVIVMALTDGVMCATTAFGLLLQKMILKGYLSWNRSGWIIQNIWQSFYVGAVVGWTFYREWPWTHTIFIVLHAMVFLMKQHSYAFYNGYLSQVYRRKRLLEDKLSQLEEMEPLTTPSSPTSPQSSSPASAFRIPPSGELHRRRRSMTKASTNLRSEESPIAQIAHALETGEPFDTDQMQAFEAVLKAEIRELEEELNGKSTNRKKSYPNNLTLANFADWTCLPTLVYELEYPRQEKINWWYVAEKTAATFGVIWVMMIISQAYIYPPVTKTLRMKEAGMSLQERWNELPWILSDMLFPLLLEQLLAWYVIWECCLNVLAELTKFADRGFYGDWWNSVSWDQYARDWNRPVHNFLLRHVYHSSISAFHLSKSSATFVTFFLSACVHELVMFCLFKKVRGYLFAMQLMQLPLVTLSRTKLLKGRNLLGNVVFWIGLFVGPSFLTSLYLIV